MPEPAAAVFAVLFVLLAGIQMLVAIRGRGRRPSGKVRRIAAVLLALNSLIMAVVVLCMSSPPIFGLSWAVRGPMALIGLLISFVVYVTILILVSAEGTVLAAYLHMPAWLYTWLYGTSDGREGAGGPR